METYKNNVDVEAKQYSDTIVDEVTYFYFEFLWI